MYGLIEASIESLESADKDLLGCLGSRFFLKMAGRKGRADVLGMVKGRELAEIWMWAHSSKHLVILILSDNAEGLATSTGSCPSTDNRFA